MFNKNFIFSLALTVSFGSSFGMLTTVKEKYNYIKANPLIPLNIIASTGLIADYALGEPTLSLCTSSICHLAINSFTSACLLTQEDSRRPNISGVVGNYITHLIWTIEKSPQTNFDYVAYTSLGILSGINTLIFLKRFVLSRNN